MTDLIYICQGYYILFETSFTKVFIPLALNNRYIYRYIFIYIIAKRKSVKNFMCFAFSGYWNCFLIKMNNLANYAHLEICRICEKTNYLQNIFIHSNRICLEQLKSFIQVEVVYLEVMLNKKKIKEKIISRMKILINYRNIFVSYAVVA